MSVCVRERERDRKAEGGLQMELRTLNPEPQLLNPESETLHLTPPTLNTKPLTRNPELWTLDPEPFFQEDEDAGRGESVPAPPVHGCFGAPEPGAQHTSPSWRHRIVPPVEPCSTQHQDHPDSNPQPHAC